MSEESKAGILVRDHGNFTAQLVDVPITFQKNPDEIPHRFWVFVEPKPEISKQEGYNKEQAQAFARQMAESLAHNTRETLSTQWPHMSASFEVTDAGNLCEGHFSPVFFITAHDKHNVVPDDATKRREWAEDQAVTVMHALNTAFRRTQQEVGEPPFSPRLEARELPTGGHVVGITEDDIRDMKAGR